ncbi:pyrroline-5-carboxylate reductase [uncultured Sphingomonas sp.]|uniref:pyrroline-5-carboxylate reductase n=1 Tax=uncultured Sphingomonas sp. TaxID=158754 RepID=UPI0025F04A8A|nr:pyrroline-5-carboxylate reductase [uncultured Sphingomonas sp.]
MSDFPITGPIWFVGCGNMGGAILRRWLEAGLDPAQVTVIRKSGEPFADGVTVLAVPPADGAIPAMVVLGVKPQMIDQIAPSLAPTLGSETTLVSILAGVELAALRQRFAAPGLIVRAMPNTPVAIGQGATGLVADQADAAARAPVSASFALLGLTEWVDEPLMDAVSALSGSGPAFLFRFVDALAHAGADMGLPADQAARLALATVAGAGALAASSAETPHQLAERVASPGGSTRRGLDVLDEPEGLKPLVRNTLTAALLRNREMAAAAR